MQGLHKSNRKSQNGFTLVEMIVVIVILAILLAILVPSMTQWITKAKNEAAFQECRQAVLAAHTYAIEQYAEDKGITVASATQREEILKLAKGLDDAAGAVSDGSKISILTFDPDTVQVSYLAYLTASGIRVKYYQNTYSLDPANLGEDEVRDNVLNTMVDINEKMNAGKTIDSGAADITTSKTAQVVKTLEDQGLTLAALNAVSWQYDGKNRLFYWSTQDITDYATDTEVPVIRYNVETGDYTVWVAKVTIGHTQTGTGINSKPYNVLSRYTQYPQGDTDKTYAGAMKLLADAQAEHPAPTPTPAPAP